jgi:hypothetical protein
VRPRYLAGHRHLTAPDPPHSGDGVTRGATQARGDDGGAGAGEASDARPAGGLQGFSQVHPRSANRAATCRMTCLIKAVEALEQGVTTRSSELD